MKTHRSFRQWWDESRCNWRTIRTLNWDVEHYPNCGYEHSVFWERH